MFKYRILTLVSSKTQPNSYDNKRPRNTNKLKSIKTCRPYKPIIYNSMTSKVERQYVDDCIQYSAELFNLNLFWKPFLTKNRHFTGSIV